jgi:hypothetical protein
VPAERAILGITDRLFTRIHTVDRCMFVLNFRTLWNTHRTVIVLCSTLRPESTFTHDVHQVAQMLHHSTRRSLLLIDEFVRRRLRLCRLRRIVRFVVGKIGYFARQGKGTSSVDGAALLLGVVEHVLARRTTTGSPKVLPPLTTSRFFLSLLTQPWLHITDTDNNTLWRHL